LKFPPLFPCFSSLRSPLSLLRPPLFGGFKGKQCIPLFCYLSVSLLSDSNLIALGLSPFNLFLYVAIPSPRKGFLGCYGACPMPRFVFWLVVLKIKISSIGFLGPAMVLTHLLHKLGSLLSVTFVTGNSLKTYTSYLLLLQDFC